jgi:hypothetical protein
VVGVTVGVSVIPTVSSGGWVTVGEISMVVGAGTVVVGIKVTTSEEFGGELITVLTVALSGGGGMSSGGVVVEI